MAKILLVEDNEQNRDMLSRRLQRRATRSSPPATATRGVDLAQAESPDLILMDLNLPVLDGWEADPSDQGRRRHRAASPSSP